MRGDRIHRIHKTRFVGDNDRHRVAPALNDCRRRDWRHVILACQGPKQLRQGLQGHDAIPRARPPGQVERYLMALACLCIQSIDQYICIEGESHQSAIIKRVAVECLAAQRKPLFKHRHKPIPGAILPSRER